MKTIICLLVLFTGLGARAESLNEIPRVVSEAFDDQKTVQDLMREFQQRGIPEEQITSIEEFLKSRGVSLETSLTPSKLGKNEISFGSARLTWNDKLQLKTGSGRILKFESSLSADKVFEQSYKALTETEVSAFDLLLPKAHANTRAVDAVSAAGWNVLMWGSEAVTTVAAGLYDGILGTTSLLVERLKTGLANAGHGHVTCSPHGDYVIDGLFKPYDKDAVYKSMKKYSEAKEKMRDPNSVESRALTEAGRRMFNDGTAKIEAFSTLFTFNKEKDVLISKDFLKKFFAPREIAKCDPNYDAKDVEAALKAPGRNDEEKMRYYRLHFTSDSGLTAERALQRAARMKSAQ